MREFEINIFHRARKIFMQTRILRFPSFILFTLFYPFEGSTTTNQSDEKWEIRRSRWENERSFSNNFNSRRIEKEKNCYSLLSNYFLRIEENILAEIQSKNVTPTFEKYVSKLLDSLLIFIQYIEPVYLYILTFLGIAYECRDLNREIYHIFRFPVGKCGSQDRIALDKIIPKIPLIA